MKRIYLNLLFVLALVCSCSDKHTEGDVIKIEQTDFKEWTKLYHIEEIIPLGGKKDSVALSNADKCVTGKSRILFGDYKAKTVFVFDRQGKFLFTAGRFGHAGNEYTDPRDVAFSQNQSRIEVLDVDGIKIYDANDGHFIEERKIKDLPTQGFYKFQPCDDGDYLLFSEEGEYSIYSMTNDGSLKGLRERKSYQMVYNRFYDSGKNYIVLPDYGQFTLDVYKEGKLSPKYVIDLGDETLPEKLLPENIQKFTEVDEMEKYFKFVAEAMENEDYLYLCLVGPSQTYYDVFYNKKTKKIYAGPTDRSLNLVITGMDEEGIYGIMYLDFLSDDSPARSIFQKYIDEDFNNPLFIKFCINEEI